MTSGESPREYGPHPAREDVYRYQSALGEISLPDRELFDYMDAAAWRTWTYLNAGWERRRRANEGIDTTALQGAVYLEARCTEAIDRPAAFLHPNTNQLRFGLYAGALTVQRLLPVPIEQRRALRETMAEWHAGSLGWRTAPAEEHLELIRGWRQWLRGDGRGRAPAGAEMHGEASILAAASFEIIRALNPSSFRRQEQPDRLSRPRIGDRALDLWSHRPLDPDEKLVFPLDRDPWRYRELPTDDAA